MGRSAKQSTRPRGNRYLRIQDLRALRHLFFASRHPVEGRYAGRHTSRQRGHSIEFNDYREYIPGDEISDLDWKVYGRSDRMFIRLFEHQSDMTVNLLVDGSASMGYGGVDRPPVAEAAVTGDSWVGRITPARRRPRPAPEADVFKAPTKFDYACLLAAAIAFLTIRQQDRVALGVAQEGLKHFRPPQGSHGHLRRLLMDLESVRPAGRGRLAESLHTLAQRTSHKGLLVMFSDLLEEQDEVLRALSLFAHRGNEVIVFQTLHADELNLPGLAEAVFVDSESDQRVRLNVKDIRPEYEHQMKQFLGSWSSSFRAREMDHNVVSTSTPYPKALQRYLFRRARAV